MHPTTKPAAAFAPSAAVVPNVRSSGTNFQTSTSTPGRTPIPVLPTARRPVMTAGPPNPPEPGSVPPPFASQAAGGRPPFTPQTLSEATITIVKNSVPALKEHSNEIFLRFYDELFERYPHFQAQFDMDRQKGGSVQVDGVPAQVRALGDMILSYAEHVDDLGALSATMGRVSQQHVSRAVVPGQYEAIGDCMIFAMREVLGDAADPEFVQAWTEAYGRLAEMLKGMEKRMG